MGQKNMQHDICTDLHNYLKRQNLALIYCQVRAITIQARTRQPSSSSARHEDLRTCS